MYKSKKKLDQKAFSRWYLNFLREYGGISPNPKSWYQECLKSKKNLIKFLGSHEVSHTFNIKSKACPISDHMLEAYQDRLSELLPCHYRNIPYSCKETEQYIRNRYSKDKHGRSIRSVRLLSKKFLPLMGSPLNKEGLRHLLSGLATEQSRSVIRDCCLRFVLTTDPKGFAQLGHMEDVDEDSCFAQDTANIDKYSLGISQNSFVIKVYHKKNIQARFWGYASNNCDTFVVTNGYFAYRAKEAHIRTLMDQFISKLMGKKLKDLVINRSTTANCGRIYTNNRSATIYSAREQVAYRAKSLKAPIVNVKFELEGKYDRQYFDKYDKQVYQEQIQEFKKLAGI